MAELRINGFVVRTVEVWRTAWPSESGREADRALVYLAPEEAQDAALRQENVRLQVLAVSRQRG